MLNTQAFPHTTTARQTTQPALAAEQATTVETANESLLVSDFDPAGTEIFKKSVCLEVSITAFGLKRAIGSEIVAAKTDKNMVHVHKDLFEAPEFDNFNSLFNRVRAYLRKHCLQPSVMKGGCYITPIRAVPEIQKQLIGFALELEGIKAALEVVDQDSGLPRYEQLQRETQARLDDLYDETEYPPLEVVLSKYSISWKYFNWISTPTNLREISEEIFLQEQEKAALEFKDGVQEMLGILGTQLADLSDTIAEKMLPDEKGKTKSLGPKTIENWTDTISMIEMKNIFNSPELSEAISKARALLSGVNAKDLKKSDSLRNHVKNRFDEIKEVAAGLVVPQVRGLKLSGNSI